MTKPLNVVATPLAGLNAIEASAGTGKTWTIAALYLRLVLEQALPVERILVVTFTKAATAELRSRIRARLVEARAAVEQVMVGGACGADGAAADPLLAELQPRIAPERAQALLTLAIENFDLAAIHTIHGFCQRALAERAFESGQAFDAELMTDDTPLLREVVQDFWRRELASAAPRRAATILARLKGPEALLATLRSLLGKPYLERRAPAAADVTAEAQFEAAFANGRALWAQRGEAALAMLRDWPGLSQVSYKPAQIQTHGRRLAAWLESGGAGDAPLDSLARFTPGALAKGTTKKATTPVDPLFDALDVLHGTATAIAEAEERAFGHLLQRALDTCEAALRQRKAQLNRQAFDDLLLRLHDALAGEGGAVLAQSLRDRFAAALIDEFQDTDPLQYAIFERVFAHESVPLFFVGDPKQAIYSFRGADLQAYLNARDAAGEPWVLGTNRRSAPPLVEAVNTLFAAQPSPFRDGRLAFHPVASVADHAALTVAGAEPPPLEVWFLPRVANEKGKLSDLGKTETTQRIAEAVAADIAGLLNRAERGEARLGSAPVAGGDIAILVKSHHQGRVMHEALTAVNVACVRYGQDSVFDTREATEVERLLLAVAEPGHEGRVRGALATDLLGYTGEQLFALEQDAAAWDAVLGNFHRWHALCRDRGFIAMWSLLLAECAVAPRLLAAPEGERRMTNLQHLSELLQHLAHDEGLDADALAKRIADERAGEAHDSFGSEARLLRLESDEHLVRIVTIHAAKGLEYPVVYCPFLWDGGRPRKALPVRFHDAADHRGVLDFGSAAFADGEAQAEAERRAEQLRLAYVALTRAKQRCVLAWGGIRDADTSPLAWLLHGLDGDAFKALDDHALRAALAALQQRAAGIAIAPLPEPGEVYQPLADEHTAFRARHFRGHIAPPWRTHSFTGWVASGAASRVTTELPDHDAHAEAIEGLAEEFGAGEVSVVTGLASAPGMGEAPNTSVRAEPVEAHSTPALTRITPLQTDVSTDSALRQAQGERVEIPGGTFGEFVPEFPRGSEAGSALHGILELGEFGAIDGALVERQLALFGIESRWAEPARAWLDEVTRCVLDESGGDGLRLCDVPRQRQLRELEFLFPIAVPNMAALAAAIGPGQGADGRLDARVARLNPGAAGGFLKGYIDLVIEHDGRLWLLDYKSNWLGPQRADYGPAALAQAMAEADYDLQALLYAVALQRLLRLRQSAAPTPQLGGAYYLFLRGMHADRPGSGVHRWVPDADLIHRVDACLARQEGGLLP